MTFFEFLLSQMLMENVASLLMGNLMLESLQLMTVVIYVKRFSAKRNVYIIFLENNSSISMQKYALYNTKISSSATLRKPSAEPFFRQKHLEPAYRLR